MSQVLERAILAAGKEFESLTTSDGARLILLPYGARVLGLFAAGEDENFLWNNSALRSEETAAALFAGEGWHNTGGDRTWIAPEIDTFFTDATFAKYWQPRQLDMSDYAVTRIHGGCRLSREMSLHLARSKRDVRLRLSKWFGPAASPIRDDRGLAAVAREVCYAGYTQRTTLESLDGAGEPAAVGIWNLLQLPEGGEMLVPLYWRTAPQKCFGEVPAERLVMEDHLLRVKIDFRGSHKIALKAAALCGRAGYVYGDAARCSLVIRNFSVNPSGTYIDAQRDDQEDFGYGFQMCRVDEPDFGSFCELEYHAPALGALPDPARSEDISQVWAFRGPRKAIGAIARTLLGATI